MVKVIHLAEDGTEVAAIEVDDFTIEVIYSGIADMLREAASGKEPAAVAEADLPREARLRRRKILTRIQA